MQSKTRDREREAIKTYSFSPEMMIPPLGFPWYGTCTSRSDNRQVAGNEMTGCHEGRGVQGERAASGLCTALPASGAPARGRQAETEAGPQWFLLCSGPRDSGDMAICQKLVVPRGTALNKTKQCEEAATR